MKSTFRMLSVTMAGVVCLILLNGTTTSAQKLPKSIYIQAQAMGTATQMGRTYGITLIIQEISTDEERSGLLEAFQQKGNEGLVNALSKMHSKGANADYGYIGIRRLVREDISAARRQHQIANRYRSSASLRRGLGRQQIVGLQPVRTRDCHQQRQEA